MTAKTAALRAGYFDIRIIEEKQVSTRTLFGFSWWIPAVFSRFSSDSPDDVVCFKKTNLKIFGFYDYDIFIALCNFKKQSRQSNLSDLLTRLGGQYCE